MPPLPTLGDAFRRAQQGRAVSTAAFTMETVEAVYTDGDYGIRGQKLKAAGRATYRVGQQVPVLWSLDRRSGLILAHSMRRSGGVVLEQGVAGVEELILVQVAPQFTSWGDPYGGWDVIFRNDAQARRLNLHEIINADVMVGPSPDFAVDAFTGPFAVGWGEAAADNLFWVLAAAYVASPPTGQGNYYPRIYLFRLSRAVGALAGATPVTATLVSTINPAAFQLPSKYNWQTYDIDNALSADEPVTWPYSSSGGREYRVIVESESAVTLIGLIEVRTNLQSCIRHADDRFSYLAAARTDATALGWEAPTTDEYRQATGLPFTEIPVTFRHEQTLSLLSWTPVEWTAQHKRVAMAWSYLRAKAPTDGTVDSVLVTLDARAGIFLETGALGTRLPIIDWTTIAYPGTPQSAGYLLTNLRAYAPAGPGFVLLHSGVVTGTGPVDRTFRLHLYAVVGGTLTLVAELPLAAGASDLLNRGTAIQLLQDHPYAIAEDSATAGSTIWPAVTQREKFLPRTGLDLTIGVALSEDGALSGKGAIADMPTGIAELDPLAGANSLRIAYHVVGTL